MQDNVLEGADTAFKSGKFKQCIDLCVRGIDNAQAEGNETELWWFRCLLAQCLGMQGRFREALSLIEAERSEHLKVDVQIHLITQRAFLLSRMGDYLLAKNLLDQAVSLAKAESNAALLAETRLNSMTLLFYLAQYDQMEECARTVLDIANERGLPRLEAGACSGIGKSLMVRGRFHEAIAWYERARTLFLGEGLIFDAVRMCSELGCCWYGLQEDDKALGLFSEALQASLDEDAMASYQIDLANIGNIYLRRGEYAAAISNYQKAVDIARELGDWISVSKWLNNLAITYSQMGNPALSAGFHKQSEEAAKRVEAARAAAQS